MGFDEGDEAFHSSHGTVPVDNQVQTNHHVGLIHGVVLKKCPATTDMDNMGVVHALRKKVMIPNMMVQMEINLGPWDLRISRVKTHSEKQKHAMNPHHRYCGLGKNEAEELARIGAAYDGLVCAEAVAKYG